MLTPEQETYILTHAYVPEHIVVLMTGLSGGEPFLIDDYFCCCKDDWVIFIGYPLQHEFDSYEFEATLEKIKKNSGRGGYHSLHRNFRRVGMHAAGRKIATPSTRWIPGFQ